MRAVARWMPAIVIVVVSATGLAEAREIPPMVQCVFTGPFDTCG